MYELQNTNTLPLANNERAKYYSQFAKAENTVKAYKTDWKHFVLYCMHNHFEWLPASAETIMNYISFLADNEYKVSTIQRRLSAISQAHQLAGHASPVHDPRVKITWAGIRKHKGVAQQAKRAAVISDIRRMVDALPHSLLGIRDRALLLIGFAGAFRRSEIVGLNVDDIQVTDEGLTVTLRRSKTDQEGAGRKVGIPYGSNLETCPVRSYIAWMNQSKIESGAVFRSIDRHGNIKNRLSDKSVALIVKRQAEAAGLNPDDYAGHSLRSGFATTAGAIGKSERSIMKQTGHRSVQMVRRYIQEGSLFTDNAASNIGL